MHIGILSADLSNHHGAANYSYNLLQALARAGVSMTILAPHNSPKSSQLDAYYALPQTTPRERMLVPKLIIKTPVIRRLLRKADLIHALVEQYSIPAAMASGKRPSLVTVHGTYAYIDKLHGWPSSVMYRAAMTRAQLICVSNYTSKIAQQHLNIPSEQAPVVISGIDAVRFRNLPDIVVKRGPTVLAAGGVKARKGTLPLVKAMVKVREQVPDVQCVILGSTTAEPGYTEQVQAVIHEYQLEETVHLMGFVDEETLLGWYKVADVFAMSSISKGYRFEGFGLVLSEASAAGLPTIGAYGSGVEDAIEHGVSGLLVDPDRIDEQLPQAILDILTNPEKAKQMGEAGRNRARKLTWDATAQQVIALYEAALRAKKR